MKSELTQILRSPETFSHGDKIVKLYNTLNMMGNNKSWQLGILNTLIDGIKEEIRVETEKQYALLRK